MTEEELLQEQQTLRSQFDDAVNDLNAQLNDFARDNANSAFDNNIFFSGLPVRRQNQFRDESFLPARSDLQVAFNEESAKIERARQQLVEQSRLNAQRRASSSSQDSFNGSTSSTSPGATTSSPAANTPVAAQQGIVPANTTVSPVAVPQPTQVDAFTVVDQGVYDRVKGKVEQQLGRPANQQETAQIQDSLGVIDIDRALQIAEGLERVL